MNRTKFLILYLNSRRGLSNPNCVIPLYICRLNIQNRIRFLFSAKKKAAIRNFCVRYVLTSSHERGCKPTVNPLKTRGPGFSHGIANSTVTLDRWRKEQEHTSVVKKVMYDGSCITEINSRQRHTCKLNLE